MSPESNSQNMVWIAVDAMGGDFGPKEIIPALNMVLQGRPDVMFLIFGDEKQMTPYLDKYKALRSRSEICHTDQTVKNDDKPSAILRNSKGTSMRMAIESVKDGRASAVVSAGNTGALMAMAKIVLKTVPGIHRPAIASVMPGIEGDTIMLDLGANILVDSENLAQFAVLGSIFAKAHKKLERPPTVGLLNVGSEEMKGPDHVRGAAEILSCVDFPGEYKGFVEGDDITKGVVDVIVADGYAGNIALKTAEGVGKLMKHYFRRSFSANPLAMLGAVFAYFPLKSLKRRMDPRLYNGGVFLGLNGVCIKSHGGADALGFSSAVIMAVRLARQGYIEQVAKDIAYLTDQETVLSAETSS
ncbi:MAG: phosphate acyltransferase PlsX [Alphaproteobacteria bacterium]